MRRLPRTHLSGIALAVAAACAPAAPPPRDAPPPAPAAAAPMPSPARARGQAAVAQNRACEECHKDIAAEWRASLHRAAHDDAVYQRAFTIEPLPFCTTCHAPEARPEGPATAEEGALGVGCVTCHLTGGAVLAAPLAPGAPDRAAPHPIERAPEFATARACAECHEFNFPDTPRRRRAEQMQSTVSEHLASPSADRSCADCHMPEQGTRRSHLFTASRDAAFVRSAVAVRAERLTPTLIRLTLTPAAAGHSFPTGDLFRRIEILAEVIGPETSLLHDKAQYLARHFESVRSGPAAYRTLMGDDRVGPGADPRIIEMDLGPDAKGRPIAYRIAYQRVRNTRSVDDRDAGLDGEVVLAQGTLTP